MLLMFAEIRDTKDLIITRGFIDQHNHKYTLQNGILLKIEN